jgi:hypothetical protein
MTQPDPNPAGAVYVVTEKMLPGCCGLQGRELVGFEDETMESVQMAPTRHPMFASVDRHGPLYTAEHVADLQAALLVLAQGVLRCASGARPSAEACAVAGRVYGETKTPVADGRAVRESYERMSS